MSPKISDPVVYRTRDPEVLAAYRAAWDAIRAYVDAVKAVLDEYGAGEYQVWTDANGFHPGQICGIDIPEDRDPPEGWRMQGDYAVPDKRTGKGRALCKALESVTHPGDPLSALDGMPSLVFTGTGLARPGAVPLEDGTGLYVTWTTGPEQCRDGEVDRAIWERVKLSEYHAAKEAAAEAAKADQAP